MKLTPAQIAELRADKNVRGQAIDKVLYAVAVRFETYERIQILTNIGSLDVVWYHTSSDATRVQLLTDQPEFFVELERQIDVSRRTSF